MYRLFLPLLLSIPASLATSVVAIRTPAVIVIGADSKLGSGDKPGGRGNGGCKLGLARNVAWGFAGTIQVDGTDYSLPIAARTFMDRSEPVAERVVLFEEWVVRQIANILPRLQAGSPDYFADKVDGRIFSEIVFASNDGGTLKMYKRRFVCDTGCNGKISVGRLDFPGPAHPKSAWTALGKTDAIDVAMKANPDLFNRGLETGVESLINRQVDATPQDTGLPIAMIRIERDKISFVKNGACGAQEREIR